MSKRSLVLLAFAVLWLAGCASTPPGQRLQEQLPATFAGLLPCADCPGIDYQLELRADHSFFLRQSYRGRGEGKAFDDIGRWSLSADNRILLLHGGDAPQLFAIEEAAERLRKLDSEGRAIASKLDYDLHRVAAPRPFEPRLALRGMYSYLAEAAQFEECRSGLRLPVAAGPAAAQLEAAYLQARQAPGERLLVALEGRIAVRQPMEGAPREMLAVDRFVDVRPGQQCEPRAVDAPLLNTRWQLVQLGAETVYTGAGQRAPSLQLLPEERAAGFSGCNRVSGGYELDELALKFGALVSTRMACPGSAVLEQTFLAALADTRRWNILGRRLELYAEDGTLLARFEAEQPRPSSEIPTGFAPD
jgi:copper homeostasis protein (lipoprotein)